MSALQKELDLSHSRLTGTIPEWIKDIGSGNLEQFKARRATRFCLIAGGLAHASSLPSSRQVENNELSGPVPGSIGSMPQLRVFWAHHNNLAGSLPWSISNSKSLLSFDVRYNPKLCGPLPPLKVDWLWAWRNPGLSQNWFGASPCLLFVLSLSLHHLTRSGTARHQASATRLQRRTVRAACCRRRART